MTFKDLKPDYCLYLLDRAKLEYSEEKVHSVGVPRYENKIGCQPRMVVDVTVEVGGKPLTYPFTDSTTKAYVADLMVATDKADVVAELKALKNSSERALKEVDHHNEVVLKCNQLLDSLDTDYHDKQATEARFGKIEDGMNDLKTMLAQLLAKTNSSVPA